MRSTRGDSESLTVEQPKLAEDVFYDTADRRLLRWEVTLRRRSGSGDGDGWHLVLPGPDDTGGLDTVVVPLAPSRGGKVPAELSALVTVLRRDAPLQPVAVRHLRQDGQPGAEVVDDAIEVRADRDHPEVPVPARVRRSDPVGEAIRADLAKYARRLILADLGVRRDLPESVHDMRVAARHLRSTLKTFGTYVDQDWARDLREELKWVAGGLSGVRDSEVQLAHLGKRAGALPPPHAQRAGTAIDTVLSTRLRRGRTEALRRLRSKRYTDLVDALVAAAHDPQLTDAAQQPCDQALPTALEHSWKLLAKRVKKLRDDSPAEDWHEVRKRAKRTRYATDLAAPILKGETKKLAKAMNEVTDVLGDLQDAHVSQVTLAQIARSRRVDGDAAYALGLLGQRQAERDAQLRKAFGPAWSKAARQYRKVQQST